VPKVGLSKIGLLKQWVKDELIDIRFNKFEDVVEVKEDKGESNVGGSAYEFQFKFNIYTESHRYRINARDSNEDDGYLGCTSSVRKPRAGENWTRGNDLADGKFTRATWERIKNDIVAYELVKIVPKTENEKSGKREIKLDVGDKNNKSIIGEKDAERVNP